jgi:hypothetical protein
VAHTRQLYNYPWLYEKPPWCLEGLSKLASMHRVHYGVFSGAGHGPRHAPLCRQNAVRNVCSLILLTLSASVVAVPTSSHVQTHVRYNIQCAFVFASACACSCMIAVSGAWEKHAGLQKNPRQVHARRYWATACLVQLLRSCTRQQCTSVGTFSSILACNICHQGRGTALLQLLRLRGGGDARSSGGQQAHSSVFLQDTEPRKTQAACKQTADAAPVSERSPQEILNAAMRRGVDAFFFLSEQDTLFLCVCVGGACG